ncbi:MAG TPA: AAA family ATPase, partial [Myxococcota bacterium]|nr:AAA family ATPase [Myxococcota bacterium]
MANAATQIVGREYELERLERLLAGRDGAALLLEGEPGIGKTTLWRHGVQRAHAAGWRVLTAQPVEAERELSYVALGDLLAPVMSEVGRLPGPQKRALRVALLLADTRGAPPEERAVAFAFASLLRLLAEDEPVLLAIDDLQWLDAPSAAVIAFAARRLDHPQLRLLAARRLGEPAIELADAQQLALAPLSGSEIGVLVRQRLETRFVAPTIEHLERVSGGNPLYALELAHEFVERGGLRPGEPLPIPQSLRALLARRLERLPPATREGLAVAAALARPTRALVEACVGAHIDLQPALDARVVRTGTDAIEFAHPLFASVLYGELEAEGRRRVHRRLAELVEDLEERAGHVAAAADEPNEPAAALLGQAAAAALARGAPTNALALARLAVELTPPESDAAVSRRLTAATLEFDAGDARLAEEALELLVADVPAADRALVLLEQARVIGELRGMDAALDIHREALASLSPDAPRLAALVNARLARALAHVGLHVEAAAHAETAVAVAERARDAAVLAESLAILAHVRYLEQGVVQTELLERAVAVAVETDVWVNNSPLFISVQQYLDQGQVEPARPLVEQLIAWTRARHDPSLALALTYEGWIELRVGNTRRALELAQEAHEVVRSAARGDHARDALALAAVGASIVGDVEQCR